jgi:hypothetical protein
MKKLTIILPLVILMVLGMKTSVMAQDDIQKYITMSKENSSAGEFYGVKFDLFGESFKKVDKITIRTPKGKKMSFKNRLEFNTFLFSSDTMDFNDFEKQFPEGEYEIEFSPRKYGKFVVNMLYNFPNPVITYPVDGAVGVPIHLTILWEPLTNITDLMITIKTTWGWLSNSLPIDATSFEVYQDLFPNSLHEVSLQATTTDFEGNALISTQTISFITGGL